MLFMSYAEEDRDIGASIAAWLGDRGYLVFNWLAPEQRSGQFIAQIEHAIGQADDFLALLSPSFLASPWCRHERDLAFQREVDLRRQQPDRTFIRVLKVAATPPEDAGFLRNYDWADVGGPVDVPQVLAGLAGKLVSEAQEGQTTTMHGAGSGSNPPALPAASPGVDPLRFRNREQELERVRQGLLNPAGPHFWLVTAPPQLGKSWFINRLHIDEALSDQAGWITRLIDLRVEPPETRVTATAVLARLFDLERPAIVSRETLLKIATQLSGTGRRHLYLLDSAELLDKETAQALRSWLSDIYKLVQGADPNDVHLSLVVASRREDEWRGVTPAPRLSALPLTEFSGSIVQQALDDLAQAMGRRPYAVNLPSIAVSVHDITEGLPALLVRCLQWIREEHWVGLERLNDQRLFEALAEPYVRAGLLSLDSLFPRLREVSDDHTDRIKDPKSLALEHSYRVLAPYRLFTQSHLRYYRDNDSELSAAVEAARWSVEDLWEAISAGALLSQPLEEPWQQLHAAIRRLLYRYFYKTSDDRIRAHERARNFVEVWGERQFGKEQIVGLVECLWHEAMALLGRDPAEFRRSLTRSAADLSRQLKSSELYTVRELQRYASERIRVDGEMESTCAHCPDLFTDLIEIVSNPPLET